MSHASTAKYASIVGSFRELVRFCAAMEPARYHPVRLNLKIMALQEALAQAEDCLAKLEQAQAGPGKAPEGAAHPAEESAREALKAVLYAKGEGLVDLANDCKTYLKTLKGPKEPELHHIVHLEFRAPG